MASIKNALFHDIFPAVCKEFQSQNAATTNTC